MPFDLGIIGAGNMAEAIVGGLIRAARIPAERIIVSDPAPQRREVFKSRWKIEAVDDNAKAAAQSRLLLLSVKPQMMAAALDGVAGSIAADSLIISIAAGVKCRRIEERLGGKHRVVRVMPNTPMLIGEGAAAICPGRFATAEDLAEVRKIFESGAIVIETSEDKMDAVTALSGSGPAYFFYLVEQLVKAGVEMGLPAEQAKLLASKTALGAAKMLMDSALSPEELRKQVTSPGGTTQVAITHLDSANWGQAMVNAVKAAQKRGAELSQ